MTAAKPPYRCAPDVLFQEVDGEIVLLDLESERYFGLNRTGARIWQLVGEGAAPDAIVDRLQREFEADRAAIARDVEALLDQLLRAGLLVRD